MEQYIEARPYTRVDILTDGEFACWSSRDGEKNLLLGPSSAGVRRTSFVVPEGHDGLIIETAVNRSIRVLSMINSDYRETPDQTRLVQDDPGPGEPEQVGDIVRAELARLGLLELYGKRSGSWDEPNEDDDDFDVDDNDVSEPWAHYADTMQMEPDYPEEAGDDKLDEDLATASARTEAQLTPDTETPVDPASDAPEAPQPDQA